MNAPRTPHLEEAEHGATTPVSDEALWYKDAVIYQLNVKAFFDSNDDGVGDFQGVAQKLDYVKELGVNTIWLMPFYPSPLKDDGYDISEYEDVHPQYGTLDDFRFMLAEAHKRDLRVITELVINHTSDQHPWFQRARRAPPGSPERDFYVWSDTEDKYTGTRIIFTDTETSNWTWDPLAKAYFWHRFFSHQPDLNFDNPLVLEAIFATMRFWLDMGVDGFRLDAIPYLVEREGTNNENLPETHAIIKQLRAAIDASYENRFLLAEANQWPEDVRDYFGDGDECHACYHFPLMPRMYMAIAQEDRYPVTEIMAQTPDIPESCQWAIFLRNHDELTLEMVTKRERDYMYQTYAADPRMRVNVGIRRRLAPLLENDLDKVKLLNFLLMTLPGTPILYYGDEIGMGDNFYLGDRNGVRTPMQWSPDRNAGFSRADPQRLYLPPIMDAVFGYMAVNVESQMRDASSLLAWMRRMLAVRQGSRAFGRGELLFLRPGNRKILAYLRVLGEEAVLCVFNLSRSAQPVELDLSSFKGRVPVEVLGRTPFPPIGDLPYLLTIPAHGFYWFRLASDVNVPSWHNEVLPQDDRPMLVLFDGWLSLFREHVVPWRIGMAVKTRNQFETDTLPHFMETQRWYAAKDTAIKRARIVDHAVWAQGGTEWLLPLVEVDGPAEAPRYFVPLAMAWEDTDEDRLRSVATAAVARIRQQANVGVMGDAFRDETFCRAMLAAIGAGTTLPTDHGRLEFRATSVFASVVDADVASLEVSKPNAYSSNTIVTFGSKVFLKGYRRLRSGINPEHEVGGFLTEVAKFPNCVPVAGVVEHVGEDGTTMTVAIVQGYVPNQGDGWNYATDHLKRFLELRRTSNEPVLPDVHGGHLALIETLGQRSAELHLALAKRTGSAAFDPEPLTADDVAADVRVAVDSARQVLRELAAYEAPLPAGTGDDAQAVLAARDGIEQRIHELGREAPSQQGVRMRIHGDYHLAQVLLARNDFIITDFEGEPGRSFEERRAKRSPLRDVAGMLRSFDYAALDALRDVATTADEWEALGPLARDWAQQSRDAFLRGYAERVRGTPLDDALLPGRGLLGLFELEKALYELRYELKNRPEWVRIPLQGILGVLGRG